MVDGDALEIDESLLSGESELVLKQIGDTLLSGSVCVSGNAYYRADQVGAASFANQLAASARRFELVKTPLQQKIEFLVRFVMLVVAVISAVILLAAVLENLPALRMVQLAAVLSGQIPYGLFLLISVAYALGAAAIAKQGALVQQINAIESLSNIDILCMDKTGTLTANALKVHAVQPLAGMSETGPERLLGIRLKIISGDDPHTVAALARQAGLPAAAKQASGPELASVTPAEFAQTAAEATVFGRVSPAQKEALVEALVRRGHHVAMVGDGVNDVLSLKKAQLGIAMQSGSQATRNVADIVLLNDSFATLQPVFTRGRCIISGMTRVVTSTLVIIAITMLGLAFPFEPAQLALTVFTIGIPTFF